MADEHQFIADGIQRTQINEFFQTELDRAGYGGMDVAKTPMGTQIVLKAEKPGMVIGKGGKNIRKITSELEERFDLDDPQIDVQEVDEPDLNAQIVADRLANALERGWYFRKAGHTTIDRIMDSGALGAEIVLSGKVTGARSRVEKFNRGYIKHNGEPANAIVDDGQGVAVMKLGTIGVTVKIIPPNAELPDDFQVQEDADISDYIVEPEEEEGVEELLEGEGEGEGAEVEAEAETETEPTQSQTEESPPTAEEEVIEEEVLDEDKQVAQPEEGDIESELDELDEEVETEAEDLLDEMEAEETAEADVEETVEGDDESAGEPEAVTVGTDDNSSGSGSDSDSSDSDSDSEVQE